MEMVILALVGLFVLIGTALLSRRTGIAAPLLLLALGIVASFTPWVPELKLNDEVVLLGILPPRFCLHRVAVFRLPNCDEMFVPSSGLVV